MKSTKEKEPKKNTNEIIREIAYDFISSVAKGEPQFLKGHQNASTGGVYQGYNQLSLAMAAKDRYSNNRWLTYKQAEALNGFVNEGETGTYCFKFSVSYKYKGNGGEFKVYCDSREEADLKAKEKDPTAIFLKKDTLITRFVCFNVEQTSFADTGEFPPIIKNMIDLPVVEVRRLIEKDLSSERDYFDRKLISLLGASFLTQTIPAREDIELTEKWLERLEEKPTYLYALANEASKLSRGFAEKPKLLAAA